MAMSKFVIGTEVACSDGVCGELRRVVIDPVASALTHLGVEPKHRQRAGHLVPIDLVDPTAKGIRLRCTRSEFEALEDAEESRFLPDVSASLGYEQGQLLSWPYYGLSSGSALGMGGMVGSQAVTTDRVPLDEVEVCRGERVLATDGPIGQIQGLVIDPSDHHVTHVLLDEGHLWGHKRVAIPINAVVTVRNGVHLSLTKDEVRDLAPVSLDY